MADDLASQVATSRKKYDYHVALNTTAYAPGVFRPGPDVPAVHVTGTSCQGKSTKQLAAWSAALGAVPIPPGAQPSAGSDSQLVVWQQSTNTVWELWKAKQAADGSWSACWGGRLDNAATSNGIYPFPYGTAASGLSELGGLLTPSEVQSGVITHALSLALPSTARRPVAPANRTDGGGPTATQLGEGSRFRLPPDYPVTGTAVQQTLIRALKTYGAVVSDRAGAVAFIGENTLAETGANAWPAALGQASYTLFDGIDWSEVQVIDSTFDAATPTTVVLPTVP